MGAATKNLKFLEISTLRKSLSTTDIVKCKKSQITVSTGHWHYCTMYSDSSLICDASWNYVVFCNLYYDRHHFLKTFPQLFSFFYQQLLLLNFNAITMASFQAKWVRWVECAPGAVTRTAPAVCPGRGPGRVPGRPTEASGFGAEAPGTNPCFKRANQRITKLSRYDQLWLIMTRWVLKRLWSLFMQVKWP